MTRPAPSAPLPQRVGCKSLCAAKMWHSPVEKLGMGQLLGHRRPHKLEVCKHPELLQRYDVVVGRSEGVRDGGNTFCPVLRDVLQAPTTDSQPTLSVFSVKGIPAVERQELEAGVGHDCQSQWAPRPQGDLRKDRDGHPWALRSIIVGPGRANSQQNGIRAGHLKFTSLWQIDQFSVSNLHEILAKRSVRPNGHGLNPDHSKKTVVISGCSSLRSNTILLAFYRF